MSLRTDSAGLAEYSFQENGQEYWVRPSLLLPTANGHPFQLVSEQAADLISINTNLSELLASIDDQGTSLGDLNQGVNSVGGIRTQLTSLLADIAAIKVLNTNFQTDVYAIATHSQDISEQLTALNSTADELDTSVDAVKTSVDTVKTSVDAVKTSVDTVKTSVDSVKTSIDAIKASLNPSTPNLINIFLVANTQKSVVIPSGAKRWSLKCRGDITNGDILTEFQVSYTTNMGYATAQATLEATGYDVVNRNSSWVQENVSLSGSRTIYLKAASAVVLSMEYWT